MRRRGVFDWRPFDELVLRYRPAVVRTAETVVGRDDAEDVAQDALIQALERIAECRDPARFGGWGLDLCQIASSQRRLARYAPATALALSIDSRLPIRANISTHSQAANRVASAVNTEKFFSSGSNRLRKSTSFSFDIFSISSSVN